MDNTIDAIIINTIRHIERLLVSKNYKTVWEEDTLKVGDPDDVRRVIEEEYPGVLTLPAKDGLVKYHKYEVEENKHYIIEYELWYDNEISDLSLIISLFVDKDIVNYSVKDVRVM